MRIGEKLKQYRISHQMKQEVLAKQLGVTASTLSNWEAGRRIPDISSLRILSETLGMTYDELLSDDDYRIHTESTQITREEIHHNTERIVFLIIAVTSLFLVIFRLTLFGTGTATSNQLSPGDILFMMMSLTGLFLSLKGKAVPKAVGLVFFFFVLAEVSVFLEPGIRQALAVYYADMTGKNYFRLFFSDGLTVICAVLVLYEFTFAGTKGKLTGLIIGLTCICGMLYCINNVTSIGNDLNELELLSGNAFLKWPVQADIFFRIIRIIQIFSVHALVVFECLILERKRRKDKEMEEMKHE